MQKLPLASFAIFHLSCQVLVYHEAEGKTWHILNDGSGDAPTIQAGVDSGTVGDTVLVAPGTYYENVDSLGNGLTLLSAGGPAMTVIDGTQRGSVIRITGNSRVQGFTLQNGLNDRGGGIQASANYVSIVDNIIKENRAGSEVDFGLGGGIALNTTEGGIIEANTIINNYAGDSGGGIIVGSRAQVIGNKIISNGCHVDGGGISAGTETVISGNLVLENWSDNFGGGISAQGATITNNTVVSNYINNGAVPQAAGIAISDTRVVSQGVIAENNIVVLNHGPLGAGTGIGIGCSNSYGLTTLKCNDVWGNDIDYFVSSGCDTASLGNITLDPKFCNLAVGDFEIDMTSPCAPNNSANCGLIGALSVGCQVVQERHATWGRLKALFGSMKGKGEVR